MSDDKVEALFGGAVITGQREPHEGTIAALEQMLEEAKSGEIVGVAAAVQYFDKASGTRLSGKYGRGMLGALVELQHCIAVDLTGGE